MQVDGGATFYVRTFIKCGYAVSELIVLVVGAALLVSQEVVYDYPLHVAFEWRVRSSRGH